MSAIPIFPEGSLSESVVTTVWVGIFVVCFFNLRFGWTFSGLVVPGYLVPLMIAKPWGAAVVMVEGILTYLIVWFLSEVCSRLGLWSSLFGRDRFFAFILCSVVVRISLDGYLLPYVGRIVTEQFQIQFDPVNTLHSFGLIIVSLIANQLWKPGLRRGLIPLAAMIFITYLLVRYGLMVCTNFGVGSLEYMYEDISSSVLASPKAYIILIIAAFMASRMNLYYAWDYNGILIPSLLALQWYEPLKILTSFVEAWFIYLLGILVLKSPLLRETTIEGARKLLLFFNIAFLYKMCIGHVAALLDADIQVTDLYGFGYLLPTLMAVKMHDKGIAARLTRTTLQTSLTATIVASIVGFSLSFGPGALGLTAPGYEEGNVVERHVDESTLIDRLRRDKVSIYRQKVSDVVVVPMPQERNHFRAGLQALKEYFREPSVGKLTEAASILQHANYEIIEIEQRYLYLVESGVKRGWGIFVIDTEAENNLLVEVPRPIGEWATMESGAYLFRMFKGRSLAISTAVSRKGLHSANDVLTSHSGMFSIFHREFGRREVLQVRGHPSEALAVARGRHSRVGTAADDGKSSLWVKNKLPASLRLKELKSVLGGYSVHWGGPPLKNTLRDFFGPGFAELYLKRADRKKLLGRYLIGIDKVQASEKFQRIDGYLREEILHRKGEIADRGTNLYKVPGIESLLFFDEEVLRPLVLLAKASTTRQKGGEDFATEIAAIQGAALALNYRLIWYRNKESEEEYLILSEDGQADDRGYWGTYVFRMGEFRPLVVEIPHPLYERNTFEYGVALFEKLRAGFLLIAGSHPKCNVDNSADVVDPANKVNLFNLVNQVILREAGTAEMLVVQVRAFGHRPGLPMPRADALLAFSDGAVDERTLGELAKSLPMALEENRLHFKFVAGDADTQGYESLGTAQAHYLTNTRNKTFVTIWLSPFVRLGYKQYGETLLQDAQMQALGIASREAFLHQLLTKEEMMGPVSSIPPRLIESLEHYQRTQDINALHSIIRLWPKPEYELTRIIDSNTQKSFLLIYREGKMFPFVGSLSYSPVERYFVRAKMPLSADEVREFVDSSAVFLFIQSADED